MIIPRDRPRPGPMEGGQASARPIGGSTRRRGRKQLAARQGRAASGLDPAPRLAGACPCNPLAGPKNATSFTPAHDHQGNEHGIPYMYWNRGTGLEPKANQRKPLIMLAKSQSGTLEPWNRIPHTRARVRAVVGSTVPEFQRDILIGVFNGLALIGRPFQPGSTGSRIKKGVENG